MASFPIGLGSELIIQEIVHLLKLLNKFERHVTKFSLPEFKKAFDTIIDFVHS